MYAAPSGGGGASGGQVAGGIEGLTKFVVDLGNYWSQKNYRQQSYRQSVMSTQSAYRENLRAYAQQGRENLSAYQSAILTLGDQADRMLSTQIAGGGDRGVSGQAAVSGLNDLRRAQYARSEAARMNFIFGERQREREGLALQENAYQELLRSVGAPVQSPDYVGAGASGAGLLLALL